MHKIKPGTLTAGKVKNSFKGTIERFVANDKTFSFRSIVRETPAYCKQFWYNVLAMINQLEIPIYILTLSSVNLRSEELSHIINKLNKLTLSNKEKF